MGIPPNNGEISDPAILVTITGLGEKNGRLVYDTSTGQWGYADQFEPAGEPIINISQGTKSYDPLFRNLDADEAKVFKHWARENYLPGRDINPVWHPVVQADDRR